MGDFKEFRKTQENITNDTFKMMDLMYIAITENKLGALKHNGPILEKIEGVQTILNFFESIEDYEKCIKLKKVLIKLNADNKQ